MTIAWNDSYCIGESNIDAQHQILFERMNQFVQATSATDQKLCAMRLYQYAREHFGLEESLMRQWSYPAMPEHLAQHEALINRLNAISASIANGTLGRAEQEALLQNWILGHIRTHDTKLAAFAQQRGVPAP